MAFFSDTPSRVVRTPRFNPQQMGAQNQMLQQAMSGLGQGGDFAPIEQRELQRFQQDTVPSIAERFTSMGGRRSSGFQEALSRGGSQLGTNLAAMKSQHGMQQQGNLLRMLGVGMAPQEEMGYLPGGPSGLSQILGNLAGGAGSMMPVLGMNMLQGQQGQQGGIIGLLMRLLGGGQQPQQQPQQGSLTFDRPRYKV